LVEASSTQVTIEVTAIIVIREREVVEVTHRVRLLEKEEQRQLIPLLETFIWENPFIMGYFHTSSKEQKDCLGLPQSQGDPSLSDS
jgi:hypothetical protein